MLSNNQIKFITSLHHKKFREENGAFIAEGTKIAGELLNSRFRIIGIYAMAGWIIENLQFISEKKIPVYETIPREMERISALTTPSQVLAVVEIPDDGPFESYLASSGIIRPSNLEHPVVAGIHETLPPISATKSPVDSNADELILALDDIRDPGNMGTMIRIADWFGIGTMICSETCVDLYNPKVVQATMGSLARVRLFYGSLPAMIDLIQKVASEAEPGACYGSSHWPVYGACLDGQSIYDGQVSGKHGLLVIGSESHGISGKLDGYITHRISIPSFGHKTNGKAESLNAAVATAVICSEFRRKATIK